MKILYNPPVPEGSPIGKGYNNFIVNGAVIDSLLPGEVKQYDEEEAGQITDVFPFIEVIDEKRAADLLEKPSEKSLKCDKCGFSTDTKIALISHQRKHIKEDVNKNEAIGIPMANSKRIEQSPDGTVMSPPTRSMHEGGNREVSKDIQNGVDRDGVEWYGGGRKEHRASMGASSPFNKGRFGGQPLTD